MKTQEGGGGGQFCINIPILRLAKFFQLCIHEAEFFLKVFRS
jgi:hypothetical protein